MIRWIHENKRSLSIMLLLSVVVLSMSFFGADVASGWRSKQNIALGVGKQEITFDQFYRIKRERYEQLLETYKKIFGDNFSKVAGSIKAPTNQELADSLITESLALDFAEELGLAVGDETLVNFLRTVVFGGQFSQAAYKNFLASRGESAASFEESLRKQLLVSMLARILQAAARPSEIELRNKLIEKESRFEIRYIELKPDQFVAEAKLPSESELSEYFRSNAERFEEPAKISYKFATLPPELVEKEIEISDGDIELYYAENQDSFSLPAEAKVRVITLLFPKGEDPQQMAAVGEKAREAHAKAYAGEDFADLVKIYSDDLKSRAKGGDLGWIKQGAANNDKELEEAIFKLQAVGVAELIQNDTGYQIVKIEEFKPKETKPFASVKDQIAQKLRSEQLPIFMATKAAELFDQFSASNETLDEFAKAHNLTFHSTAGLLGASNDIDKSFSGLTAKILKESEGEDLERTKFLVEYNNQPILSEIVERKGVRVPLIDEVRDRLIVDWKTSVSGKLAVKKGEKLLEILKANNSLTLEQLAKDHSLKLQTKKDIRSSYGAPPFADPAIKRAIFSSQESNRIIDRLFESEGNFYLFEVVTVVPPTAAEIDKLLVNHSRSEIAQSGSLFFDSLTRKLKAISKIQVAPALLESESIE
ncbi:MAG TPA: SurA N-terminal domain-containing protein [Oligoflexia bacterium]|nr:SurA N-terminal domain-containing protein [Oligoflexia bacterium]HMP27520.1 SurA N-terminal domain-containing protein [Oligoflexia bacterium]